MPQRLKLFIPLLIFVLMAALFWAALRLDTTQRPSALVGKPVPAFDLPTVLEPERRVTQEIFRGQVSLLNVWATWCVACYVEHPFLVELAQSKAIPIYGVNYRDDVAEARVWLRDLHDPYVLSVVDADGRLGIDLGVYGAPETYVIDSRGIIRHRHVGVVDERVWQGTLQPLIEQLRAEASL